jgi:hypothetical protein
MISYKMQSDGDIAVRVDGRKVGRITLGPHGFRYYPSVGGGMGAAYATLAECKESLEAS